jgi:GH15 family glucan-1,4-alpha-glucosidase
VTRTDGYLPLREYAAIGDGRTVALVGIDGSIDWLCLPDLDSPSVFASILDPGRGGCFALAPTVAYDASRRYVPDTNVVETTFVTPDGTVRITDALTLPTGSLGPYRELARRVEGVFGRVPLRWSVEPRFGYAGTNAPFATRNGVPVAASGADAVAVLGFDAGAGQVSSGSVTGAFVAEAGARSLVALVAAHAEPLVFPSRREVEARLDETITSWRRWTADRRYDGPWHEEVIRSALALKLLVFAPSGAIAAAPTTSLPEELGGVRNWDYRFSWPRDAAFTIRALLALGCSPETEAYFWWTMHASQLSRPRLRVLYRLDGGAEVEERELPLRGYRDSRPVHVGNGAAGQTQLDLYGELLGAASAYVRHRAGLDRDHARRLAAIADHVCDVWRDRDAGIWEVRSEPAHFTQSKIMCAIALATAAGLADRGLLPQGRVARWRSEERRVRAFVEDRCWSEAQQTYVRAADDERVDASLLLAVTSGYAEPRSPTLMRTVDAIRRDLMRGPLVHRYLAEDGLPGEEGAFVACSFWLVEALARQGRVDEAAGLMEDALACANDVGLFAEQIAPATGEFLGNFPQGLSHLALVNAAVAIGEAAT